MNPAGLNGWKQGVGNLMLETREALILPGFAGKVVYGLQSKAQIRLSIRFTLKMLRTGPYGSRLVGDAPKPSVTPSGVEHMKK